jgi:hypothetical protein
MKYIGHSISRRYDNVKVTIRGRSIFGRRVEYSNTFPRYEVYGKSDRQLLKMVAKQTKYFWNIPFIL